MTHQLGTINRNSYDKGYGFLRYIGYTPENIANCTMAYALDTTVDEVCLVLTWTGAGTGKFEIAYQIPPDFWKFLGHSDDLSFQVKQTGDSGDGADVTVAIEVYDNAGSNISDASLSASVTSVASFVTRDCAISDPDGDGVAEGGDYIYVLVTIAGTLENNDVLTMTIPVIKYRRLS